MGLFNKNAAEYLKKYRVEETIPKEIARLAEDLSEARARKDYASADTLRAEILAKGYSVMIGKDGVTVKKQ